MTDRPARHNRLDALARRLARPRRGLVAPIPMDVFDEMLKDMDIEHGDAQNVKGGARPYTERIQCGAPGYVCPLGATHCYMGMCSYGGGG